MEDQGDSHFINCTVGHSDGILALIDSGSDWNVVSEADWEKLSEGHSSGKAVLYDVKERPGDCASAFGSERPLEALRSFHAWVSVSAGGEPSSLAKFFVVTNGARTIIGRETAIKLRTLQVGLGVRMPLVAQLSGTDEMEEVKEFPAIPNYVLDFDVDETVKPSVKAYVNIPEAFRSMAIERLRKMERQGIVEKVKTAPRWVSGLSAVPKGNMVGPNRAIRRRFYKMPTMDAIKAKLCGAKIFSKLDLTSAFHHVKISESAKDMTTFLGPDGLYRFCRLITSA